MTLTFKTKKHLEMGLPIGAVSPIDFGKYQGCEVYVIETGAYYEIQTREVQSNC